VLGGVVATEYEVWAFHDVPGPRLGRALPLFVLLAVPYFWARRRPLLVCAVVMGAVVANSFAQGSPEGFYLIYAIVVISYAGGAYGSRRSAFAALAVLCVGYTIYALEDHNVTHGKVDDLWAAAFFGVGMLGCWLLGVWVHSRRDAASLGRVAERAVAEERARMARELHDIVSHNLSVVVTQAAGARAAGTAEDTLEKIERSGREALVEMRRLLGVLREDGDGAAIAPQPSIAELEALAANVRSTGLAVELEVDERCLELPPALGLAVYRIVQEALTNSLKHAEAAHVRVDVRRRGDGVRVEVVDDGAGVGAAPGSGGHGLVGMHERVAHFGGELRAGPRPEGGFGVEAILPVAP